ncbi:gamma-glutamylcyclotransferase family protein [Granulosicoccus sp. 3-233]|uniref:gamma-glutamylcyclotransferase family protein n=1 Tax=Granulosicoccus sp. 3-233 TaxID=3417969 RepID=UPI003D34F597
MNTDWIHYFGYGSLVNRETRPADEIAHSARLNGWQRVWDHRVTDPAREKRCTSLSIEPTSGVVVQPGQEVVPAGIDGVVVRLPLAHLPQLDAREAGYDRLSLPLSDFELSDELRQQMFEEGVESIMVYRSQTENRLLADQGNPVLQSYVDCVMAGYLQRFGEQGVQDMVNSTRGWECPLFDDRRDPFYPRWVDVDDSSRQYFDSLIMAQLDLQQRSHLA